MALRSYSVLDILLPSIIIIVRDNSQAWIHINVCRVSCGCVFNMLLVQSVSFYFNYNICGCMCSTGPFKYRWLKGYISIAHVIIIIKSEVSTFPIVIIFFPWLCAWDVCCIIFCHLLHIRSGKTGNLFSSLLCSLWWVQIVGYVLPSRSYSFVCTIYHFIIIIVQTYLKTLSSVWVRLSRFSQLSIIQSIIQYVRLCVLFTLSPCDDWEAIYNLSYYHHQIGSMSYYQLFRVKSWNNGVRCMSFYILMGDFKHRNDAALDSLSSKCKVKSKL